MPSLRATVLTSALILASCDESTTAPVPRVVVIADTHVIGPQYTTPTENSPADNASILLAPDRLRAIRDHVNAMDPAPEAVFVLGDVLHDAHHSPDLAWYDANRNAFTVAQEIFAEFDVPVHVVMGNHDYEHDCDGSGYPRSLSEELFRRFFGVEPWYAVDYGGVRFAMLNGQQGPTWDETSPDCNTSRASFGAAQLGWLDEQLDEGVPTVLMSHYMGLLWKVTENPAEPTRKDLATVASGHPNVAMVLAGHTHRWLDFSDLLGHPHYVVGPSRYDDDNFWVLELNGPKGEVFIRDRDKAIWQGSCAETFVYRGDHTPELADGATETGTCVVGVE